MRSIRVAAACMGVLLLAVASRGVHQNFTMLDISKQLPNFNITIIERQVNNINIYVGSAPGEVDVPAVPAVSKTFYLAKDKKLNWHSAYYYCRKIDLDLVQVRSSLETIALQKFIEVNNEVGENFWIGGNTLEDGYIWHWGIDGDLIQYKNWASGEPRNISGFENCIAVDGKAVEWSVLSCVTQLYAICEGPGTTAIANGNGSVANKPNVTAH